MQCVCTNICLPNSPVLICSEGDKVGEKDKTVWKMERLGSRRKYTGRKWGWGGWEKRCVGEAGRCVGATWTGRCVERIAGGTACGEGACGDAADN